MRGLTLTAVAIAVVLLAACGGSGVRSGVITAKEFEAEHEEHWIQPIPQTQCFPSGKTTSCSTTYLYLPQSRHVDDHWDFKLKDCANGEEDCKTGEVAVDKETFDRYREGERYEASR